MGYGEGSIYQQPERGRWVATVEVPRYRDTPRRRKTFTGKTREAVEAKLAAYRLEHPTHEHLGRQVYAALGRALGSHTDADWWRLVRSVDRRCHYCGIRTTIWTDRNDPTHLEKDHRTPLSRGGSDAPDNLAVSCRGCNLDKRAMTEEEYLTWKATS